MCLHMEEIFQAEKWGVQSLRRGDEEYATRYGKNHQSVRQQEDCQLL